MRNRTSATVWAPSQFVRRWAWFLLACLATPVLLFAQEPDSTVKDAPRTASAKASSETAPETELDPQATLQPWSFLTLDSDGNVRQQYKMEGDHGVGHQVRIGLMLGQTLVHNVLISGSSGSSEQYADAGVTGHWHPNQVVKFEGMVGASRAPATVNANGQSVPAALIPITNLMAHLTPAGDSVVIDAGFNRAVYSLSPQLVANRIVRDKFVLHPQVGLPSGWRFRELFEAGPMTGPGERNARYNSEFTVARGLGKNSELYASFEYLHYAKATDSGYYAPDQEQAFEGGWSQDIKRTPFLVSLEFAAGTGHSKEHQDAFGPWGLSLRAQADFAWTVRHGRELHASYEYDYNQFNPATVTSTPGPWSMTALTVYFRWSKK